MLINLTEIALRFLKGAVKHQGGLIKTARDLLSMLLPQTKAEAHTAAVLHRPDRYLGEMLRNGDASNCYLTGIVKAILLQHSIQSTLPEPVADQHLNGLK